MSTRLTPELRQSIEQLDAADQQVLVILHAMALVDGAPTTVVELLPASSIGRLSSLGLAELVDARLVLTPVGAEVTDAIDAVELAAGATQLLDDVVHSIIDPVIHARTRAALLSLTPDEDAAIDAWHEAALSSRSLGHMAAAALDWLRAAETTSDATTSLELLHERARAIHIAGGELAIGCWTDLGVAAAAADISVPHVRELLAESHMRRFWLGDEDGGSDLLRAATELDDGTCAWALRGRAITAFFAGDTAAGRVADHATLAAARRTGDRRLEAIALSSIANDYSTSGQLAEAITAQRAALSLAADGPTDRTRIEGTVNLSDMLFEQLAIRTALDELVELERRFDERIAPGLGATIRIPLAWLHAQAGDMKAATTILETTAQGTDSDSTWARMLGRAVAAQTLADAGRLDVAQRLLTELATMLETTPAPTLQAEHDITDALLRLARGDVNEARDIAAGVQIDEPLTMAMASLVIGHCGALRTNVGAIEQAAGRLRAADEAAPGSPFAELALCHLDALALASAGDVEAGEQVAALGAQWRSHGYELIGLRALEQAGHVLLRAGAERRGLRCLADAARGYSDCDARADHARIMALGLIERAIPTTWSLLAGAPPEAQVRAAQVIATGRIVRFQRGELVTRANDAPSHAVYFLRRGQIRLFRERPDGKQLLVGIVSSGDAFGPGLTPDGVSQHDAMAAHDCELHVVSADQLWTLASGAPEITAALMASMSADVTRSQELAEMVAFAPIEARLATVLLQLDERHGHPTLAGTRIINERFTQGELAAMIGASREQVARAVSRWRKDEVIRLDGKRIIILDREELQRRAAS